MVRRWQRIEQLGRPLTDITGEPCYCARRERRRYGTPLASVLGTIRGDEHGRAHPAGGMLAIVMPSALEKRSASDLTSTLGSKVETDQYGPKSLSDML